MGINRACEVQCLYVAAKQELTLLLTRLLERRDILEGGQARAQTVDV
jgi:hypothetical protein